MYTNKTDNDLVSVLFLLFNKISGRSNAENLFESLNTRSTQFLARVFIGVVLPFICS